MKALVENINAKIAAFQADAEKNIAGNKAAGVRARKASLELEKLLKEFRKVSVK
ncbi:MAG: histone H1 [Bacteroidales bacterium]|nr:histone H1 [Bacteroidales bacterium]